MWSFGSGLMRLLKNVMRMNLSGKRDYGMNFLCLNRHIKVLFVARMNPGFFYDFVVRCT